MPIELAPEELTLLRQMFKDPGFQKIRNARIAKNILGKVGVVNAGVYTGDGNFVVTDAADQALAALRDCGVDVQEVQ